MQAVAILRMTVLFFREQSLRVFAIALDQISDTSTSTESPDRPLGLARPNATQPDYHQSNRPVSPLLSDQDLCRCRVELSVKADDEVSR